jgi:hypothetical protein
MQPTDLSTRDASARQGFDEGDAADALLAGGGLEAAVALLVARDHQEQVEASMRGVRADSGSTSRSSSTISSVASTSPAVLSSSLQFCVHVSDIESGEQVRCFGFRIC